MTQLKRYKVDVVSEDGVESSHLVLADTAEGARLVCLEEHKYEPIRIKEIAW